MRRTWAAPAATVLCLALGVPTVAQETSDEASPVIPTGPAIVTGQMANMTEGTADDPYDHRDVSDLRVSGEAVFVNLVETNWTGSGSLTINGPGGDWSGPVIAVLNQALGGYLVFLSADGSGDYEGWAFVATYLEKGDGHPEVNGVIYRGDPPRQVWSETVEPPAQ